MKNEFTSAVKSLKLFQIKKKIGAEFKKKNVEIYFPSEHQQKFELKSRNVASIYSAEICRIPWAFCRLMRFKWSEKIRQQFTLHS